jgi:hypothetical protein
MKHIYIAFIFLFIGSSISAQELFTCYDEYRKVFENRGADPVQDGIHDNIIVTIRKGDEANCFVAKVTVKQGLITQVELYFDDSTSELKEWEWSKKMEWTIFNGMSKTRVTTSEELITVMFTNKIKPKKKKLMTAPKPKFELN